MRSSLAKTEVEVVGQTLRFSLFGVTSLYYIVKAPTTEGDYVFLGASPEQRPQRPGS